MKFKIELDTPVKLLQDIGDYYSFIIEDKNGTRHYFDKDGEYDGYDRESTKKPSKVSPYSTKISKVRKNESTR